MSHPVTRVPAYVWGNNTSGGLGLGHTARVSDPVPTTLPEGTVDVRGGVDFTVARTASGTVYAWGGNESGQLGDGTTDPRRSPAPVALPGDAPAVMIAVGADHVLALTAAGDVLAWGGNSRGQVGDGSGADRLTPQVVHAGGIVSVGAGAGVSAAVTREAGLLTWGRNDSGQLAVPGAADLAVPTRAVLPPATVVAAVAAGRRHLVVRTRSGQVLMFGVDAHGDPVRGEVGLQQDWGPVRALRAGDDFTLALTTRGVLLAWGANGSGQLGVGDRDDRLAPAVVRIPQPHGPVTDLHAGARSAVAVTDGSAVYAWGEVAAEAVLTPRRVPTGDGVVVTGLHGGAHHTVLTVAEARPADDAER
jgi:alpha-tubulin suppressor-like RCC1 family protein